MTGHHTFALDEKVRVHFHEHSIPTTVEGVIVMPIENEWITIQATDGWKGEAGNIVRVPWWRVERAS